MFVAEDKILFVFSDPGGAKPLLALIAMSEVLNYRIVSDRVYSFYNDFGIEVHPYNGKVQAEIDAFKPTKIFTATSYTSDIEKEFIAGAKKNGIPCISFVDHWTNIAGRFRLTDGNYIYPDQIWVIDERAKMIGINEGVNSALLHISGNPYHLWLKNWKPKTDKSSFLQSVGVKEGKKILLFAPDPLSNINGKDVYGFDEVSAAEDLCTYYKENPSAFTRWTVLLKPHPNQDIKKLEKSVKGCDGIIIIADNNADTNTCIYYSDLVLGFHSSFLIEAHVLGKKIVRFVPSGKDPLQEILPGTVITEINALEKYLDND